MRRTQGDSTTGTKKIPQEAAASLEEQKRLAEQQVEPREIEHDDDSTTVARPKKTHQPHESDLDDASDDDGDDEEATLEDVDLTARVEANARQAQAPQVADAIQAAIARIKAYVDANDARYFGKNVARSILFKQLVTAMTPTAAKKNDVEKLHDILHVLGEVKRRNETFKKTSKDSALALQEAFQIIDPVYRSALIKENAELRALNAPATLTAAKQEGWNAHIADVAQKAADAKKKSLEDPLALVTKAIQDGNFDKLDLEAIYARLNELSKSDRTSEQRFSEVQLKFYNDLKATLTDLRSPISKGILMLLAQSPLADRYAALVEKANKSKQKSSKELRAMLRTIGDIVRICLTEENASLQDLHNLFMVRDEKKLLEVLRLLQAEKMLSLKAIEVPATLREVEASIAEISVLLEDAQSEELDMGVMGEAVKKITVEARSAGSSSAADSGTRNLEEIGKKINEASNFYVNCVKLSTTISLLTEEIKASSQQLASLTQMVNNRQRYDLLKTMAADLAVKYTMLINLTKLVQENQTNLVVVVEFLNRAYQEQKGAQSRGMSLELQTAAAALIEDYARWNSEHVRTQENLTYALAPFAELISPEAGVNATVGLTDAVKAGEQEEALLTKIRTDAQAVQVVLQQHAQQGQPNNSVPQTMAVESRGPVSVKLAVDLANKFSANKSDAQPGVKLIEKLQSADFFVPEIQSKLLRHPNVGVLLRLQTFLEESSIRVSPAQLNKLWDKLLRNDPDFELLKPLQAQLHLPPETIVMIIEKFSETWEGSLTLLNDMFAGKDAHNQAVFNLLIDAAKDNNGLIESVYKIYKKLVENQEIEFDDPEQQENQAQMLVDFFNPANMAELIDCIKKGEYGFADEVVMRLDAVNAVPFKSIEDLSYLLKRTKQFDELNLSYTLLLKTWQETPQARGQYFDDANRTLLASFDKPQYDGGLQLNAKPTRRETKPGDPAIANVAYAQKVMACAYSLPRPVDYVSLQAEGKRKKAANVNLNPEEQFLLELEKTVSRSRATVFMDSRKNPSLVVWLHDPRMPVLDHYSYFVIDKLKTARTELFSLMQRASTLNQQLVEEGKVAPGTYMLALDQPISASSVVAAQAVADERVAELKQLIDRIEAVKLALKETVNSAFRDAFEDVGSADLTFGVAHTARHRMMPTLSRDALEQPANDADLEDASTQVSPTK